MRLIEPRVEFLWSHPDDPIKAIEVVGRTCYKSENKITDDSAKKFVEMLIKRGHEAMIEHSNFILRISQDMFSRLVLLDNLSFIRLTNQWPTGAIVSGNARAFRDMLRRYPTNTAVTDLCAHLHTQYPILFNEVHSLYPGEVNLIKPDDLSYTEQVTHRTMTMKFICDRGVSHELVRHRLFSLAQESTRFCNYQGGCIFIIPSWFKDHSKYEGDWDINPSQLKIHADHDQEGLWFAHMRWSEMTYQRLVNSGWSAQYARSVLPNSLKTEVIVTGNIQEWRHFFKLRCDKAAHPQMRQVANAALELSKFSYPNFFTDFPMPDE